MVRKHDNFEAIQGCTKGQKSGGAGSNAACRRCLVAPSDLPKSGGAAAPPAPPLATPLLMSTMGPKSIGSLHFQKHYEKVP